MFPEERKSEILKLVQEGKPVRVGSLSKRFGISESTVRRDLQEMEESGLIQRTHGGAVSASAFELSFQEKEIRFLNEKQCIAREAAKRVKDGDAVLLDSGTTTLELARMLKNKRITVATNSTEVAEIFIDDPQVEVLVLGGTWRKATRSLVGYLTNEMLKQIHFDKVFLAANGVDSEMGITTPNSVEAETKRHMVQSGEEVILLVDHSKIGQKGLYRICGLTEVDLIITDSQIDEADLELLQKDTRMIKAPLEG